MRAAHNSKHKTQNSQLNNGTFNKSFLPVHLRGQHDIRLLPRHVLVPCRVEEREDIIGTGSCRYVRVARYRACRLSVADKGARPGLLG